MKDELRRVAFSPGEFAILFGKSQTWGYRQIYAGKVKAITEHGRMLIPAAEVEKILGTAGVYNGPKPKAPQTKAQLQRLTPKLDGVWQRYIKQRRESGANQGPPSPGSISTGLRRKLPWHGAARQEALARLGGRRSGNTGKER